MKSRKSVIDGSSQFQFDALINQAQWSFSTRPWTNRWTDHSAVLLGIATLAQSGRSIDIYSGGDMEKEEEIFQQWLFDVFNNIDRNDQDWSICPVGEVRLNDDRQVFDWKSKSETTTSRRRERVRESFSSLAALQVRICLSVKNVRYCCWSSVEWRGDEGKFDFVVLFCID